MLCDGSHRPRFFFFYSLNQRSMLYICLLAGKNTIEKKKKKKQSRVSHIGARTSFQAPSPHTATPRAQKRRATAHLFISFVSFVLSYSFAFLPPFFRKQLSVTSYYCHFILYYIRRNQRASMPDRGPVYYILRLQLESPSSHNIPLCS